MPPSPVVICLFGIEREDGRRPLRAEPLALVPRAERLARVVDQREAVLRRNRADLVELARIAVDVDRDDRLRARRDRRLDRGGIHVQRPRVDVGEHRSRALVDEAVGRRGERVRGRDHLVARSDAGGDAQQVQARGSGRDGGRVRRADLRCDHLLEAVDRRAEREPTGPEDFDDRLLFPLVEIRPRQRDGARFLWPHFLLHASARVGAYSSHWPQRSLRPWTVSRYACWIANVTAPSGTEWSSTSRIGVTSAAVPTMKTSSAR